MPSLKINPELSFPSQTTDNELPVPLQLLSVTPEAPLASSVHFIFTLKAALTEAVSFTLSPFGLNAVGETENELIAGATGSKPIYVFDSFMQSL